MVVSGSPLWAWRCTGVLSVLAGTISKLASLISIASPPLPTNGFEAAGVTPLVPGSPPSR